MGTRLSEHIRFYRERANMTTAEAAERLCVPAKSYAKIESGADVPGPNLLRDIADLFSVTVDALIGGGVVTKVENVERTVIDSSGMEYSVRDCVNTSVSFDGYSAQERQIINIYRSLDLSGQIEFLQALMALRTR